MPRPASALASEELKLMSYRQSLSLSCIQVSYASGSAPFAHRVGANKHDRLSGYIRGRPLLTSPIFKAVAQVLTQLEGLSKPGLSPTHIS